MGVEELILAIELTVANLCKNPDHALAIVAVSAVIAAALSIISLTVGWAYRRKRYLNEAVN